MSDKNEIISSYLPALIRNRIGHSPHSVQEPSLESFQSAFIFTDISGFSKIARELSKEGARGLETLVSSINSYFGALIDIIHHHGGDIVKFAGDALWAIWSAENCSLKVATQIAATCSMQIKRELCDDNRTPFTMKVSLSAGEVKVIQVGGEFGRWELFVAGENFTLLSEMDKIANPNDVVISLTAKNIIEDWAKTEPISEEVHRLLQIKTPVTGVPPAKFTFNNDELNMLSKYIPAAILKRMDAGLSDWIAELRTVSVLFVNIRGVNFESDNALEQVQKLMLTLQKLIYRHEGSVNRLNVESRGIVVLAAFGLPPLAHEDDVRRAVKSALEIYREIHALGYHISIGVANGTIFCGSIGNNHRREYTLHGDVVNLAARLMQLEIDGVQCDEEIYTNVQNEYEFSSRTNVKLKGLMETVTVYMPSSSSYHVAVKKSELVGRTSELKLIMDMIRDMDNAKSAVVSVIEGETGIGKSRFIGYLMGQAKKAGMGVLYASAESSSIYKPLFVFQQILTDLLIVSGDLEQLALLREIQQDKNAMSLMLNIFLRHASNRKLVIAIDDAHFMDMESLTLCFNLCLQCTHILFINTVAPQPSLASLPSDAAPFLIDSENIWIRMENLEPSDAIELVKHKLNLMEVPSGLQSLVEEKANGHPFYTEEIVTSLLEGGAIVIENGVCIIKQDLALYFIRHIPGSIQGLITRRLDRLLAVEQLIVKVASVIGREFTVTDIHEIYPAEESIESLRKHLHNLERLDIFTLITTEPETRYQFRHHVTRDVAYGTLVYSHRKSLHRAIAMYLEKTSNMFDKRAVSELARHWYFADFPEKSQSYSYKLLKLNTGAS